MIKTSRLYEEKYNNQGCLMKIIDYNNAHDILIQFQDKYKAEVRTSYMNFKRGIASNPYYPQVCGVGMVGNKCPASKNHQNLKEYKCWYSMLERCFDEKVKGENFSYNNITCCEEWLLYENFYEWLHSQDNFDKWYNGKHWALDKDIIIKNNKIYSSETCCLVPQNINCLFTKRNAMRGNLPIGVSAHNKKFISTCNNPFTNKTEHLGVYQTIEEAFQTYKQYKESIIKQVAQIEYSKGNIIKQCYDAMMKYEVEITD